jgi:beta-1,4-mannosyl-glycoprotein beta-1,4-N-acetylglucosaminyltransferase
MIYDCFNFLNEEHILEIRIEELNSVVDKFVICESDITVSNIRKPFFLEDSEVYKKYKHKIIYHKLQIGEQIVSENFKNGADNYRHILMYNQRNAIMEALKICKDDDIIMFSDLDEIPKKKAVSQLNSFPCILTLRGFYWYLNTPIFHPPDHYWFPSVICDLYKNIKDKSLNTLRETKHSFNQIPDAGWHFSHLGDENQISYKMMASSHNEYHNAHYTDPINIKRRRENLIDPYDRGWFNIRKDGSIELPEYVLNNRQKFNYLLK